MEGNTKTMRGYESKIHPDPSPLRGATVEVVIPNHAQISEGPHEFVVEDYWDRVTGESWMWAEGNPAALGYAIRVYQSNGTLPIDDEVLYGKIGAFGYLVHVSEVQS